jgi:hypothetical protein
MNESMKVWKILIIKNPIKLLFKKKIYFTQNFLLACLDNNNVRMNYILSLIVYFQ